MEAANDILSSRWKAVITYRADAGPHVVTRFFDEIVELDEIIESGPSWDAMVNCVVTLANPTEGDITIEQAAAA